MKNTNIKMKAIVGSIIFASTFANAASSAEVMFKAFDSRGNDTNTCMATTESGYALLPCASGDAAQTFTFDTNVGGDISQEDACVTISDQSNPWENGVWLANRACSGSDYTSKSWRWTNGDQIIATEAPGQSKCMTADGVRYTPPRLVLLDCVDKTKLTSWDVVFVN